MKVWSRNLKRNSNPMRTATGFFFLPMIMARVCPDDNERLDIYNGLLLTPNLDKAFDLGYIGFRATGKICISPELEEPSVLGVTPELSISLTKRHMPYIDHHLEIEFKN